MPWMVSIDALEYDLIDLEKKFLSAGYGHALDILRTTFSHPREAYYVEDPAKLQASVLHTFKHDRIIPDLAPLSRKRGG